MAQKIPPWDVILVPNLCLVWADQLKEIASSAVPSIYKEVHELDDEKL